MTIILKLTAINFDELPQTLLVKKINFSDLKMAAKQVQIATNKMSMDKITILRICLRSHQSENKD